MPADLVKARSEAVRLLLSSRLYSLKIDVTKLKYDKNIIVGSFSSFCENSLATMEELESVGGLRDGCTVRRETADSVMYLVLYNDKVTSQRRRRFTLAHELGHIILEHKNDGAVQEAEANRFAAELILPRILVWELNRSAGFKLATHELAEIFGVSRAVCENQMQSLGQSRVFSDDEKLLLNKLKGLLPELEGPVVDCE